jgi:hypothetical protein
VGRDLLTFGDPGLVDLVAPLCDADLPRVVAPGFQDEVALAPGAVPALARLLLQDFDDASLDLQVQGILLFRGRRRDGRLI